MQPVASNSERAVSIDTTRAPAVHCDSLARRVLRQLREALPESAQPPLWRNIVPRTRAGIAIAVAVGTVFAAYLFAWVRFHWPWLADPLLQNDDARIQVFPFHRFGPEGALADDEMALDQLAAVPPAFVALYAVLIKLSDLYVASKLVQLLLLGIVAAAGYTLARRSSLGLGLLLVFLVLQSEPIINRMAGGLPRGFGYPVLSLWVAGALTASARTRAAAVLVGALFYPSAAALSLGAEGFLRIAGLRRASRGDIVQRAKRYLLLVAAAVVLIVPFSLTQAIRAGEPVPYAQAKRMEVFTKRGRLSRGERLPLPNPAEQVGHGASSLFVSQGHALFPKLIKSYRNNGGTGPLVILGVFVAAVLVGLSPVPTAAVALGCASLILYALARSFAFRLYVPDRYLDLGLPMTAVALVLTVVGGIREQAREGRRRLFTSATAALVIAAWWAFLGSGYTRQTGMHIDGRSSAALYAFMHTLPVDARIAAHPADANGLPYWGARATVTNVETACPWFVDNWKRYDRRTRETLEALYSTDRGSFLAYVKKYRVTHLFLRRSRYGKDFKKRSAVFEPYTSYMAARLKNTKRKDLVLYPIPKSAVVFGKADGILVSVEKLRAAWKAEKKKHGKGSTRKRTAKRKGVEQPESTL